MTPPTTPPSPSGQPADGVARTLYLIRHAHAGTRDPSDPNDHLRPLSGKGHAQADALERTFDALGVTLNRLFSSPYTRAAQTAAPLAPYAARGAAEFLSTLTYDDYPALLGALSTSLKAHDTRVALVGHEPYLSELAAYLLTGDAAGMSLKLAKGMVVRLEGPLGPGSMTLHTALPPKLIKRLAAR